MAVIVAAHGLSRAAATGAYANDSDRGAVDTEENVDVLNHDAEQTQEGGARSGAGLSNSRLVSANQTDTGRRSRSQWNRSTEDPR